MKKLILSSNGDDPVEVVDSSGSGYTLKGTTEQCEKCKQPKVAKGTSVVLEVPDGYTVRIVKDEE